MKINCTVNFTQVILCVTNCIRYMKLTILEGKEELGVEFVYCGSGDTQYKSVHGIMGELYSLYQ